MPTKVAEASPAADAVDEAIRAVSGVAQHNVEQAKRMMSSPNSLMTEQLATGRRLYEAWADGFEAVLKASFAAQNTLLGTAPGLFEAAHTANKTVLGTQPPMFEAVYTAGKTIIDSVPGMMQQYQKAVLDIVEEASASTEKLLKPSAR